MVGQPERRYHDIVWVVSNLYASRIHVGLQTCGDGLRIWISDRLFKTGLTIRYRLSGSITTT
jgi:hypothetical protein